MLRHMLKKEMTGGRKVLLAISGPLGAAAAVTIFNLIRTDSGFLVTFLVALGGYICIRELFRRILTR